MIVVGAIKHYKTGVSIVKYNVYDNNIARNKFPIVTGLKEKYLLSI